VSGRIERIVVSLDAVSETGAAIDTAVQLAARWKARLHGMFIEDQDLLRLASLPFARQVSVGSGPEPLTSGTAAQQLRALAEAARRDLAAAAGRHDLRWSFEIVQGTSSTDAPPAAAGDFVVASAVSRPVGAHFRIATRRYHVGEPASGSLLLTRATAAAGAAVVVVLRDREPASARLLETAAQLAEFAGARLTVICPPDLALTSGFEAWLNDHAAAHPVQLRIEPPVGDPAALHQHLVDLGCGLLALAADSAEAQLLELMAGAACNLLVMR